MNKLVFEQRRKSFINEIGPFGMAILFAAKDKKLSYYQQESNFYYFTGFKEPEAVAVFIPGRENGEFLLFSRVTDADKEAWYGAIAGQDRAHTEYGADQTFSIESLDSLMPEIIRGRKKIFIDIENNEVLAKVHDWIKKLKPKDNRYVEFAHVEIISSKMRAKKDDEEISLMRKSSEIIAQAQKRVMSICRPDMREYEIEAEILHECVRNGARFLAFESIVASGANTCIMHYTENNGQLKDGDLLLVDAGIKYDFYASDITRTIPINGHFNEEQRLIYQAVLDAQLSVLSATKPGIRWLELQQIAEKVITEKLLELDLIRGNLDELIAQQAFLPFFIHKIGHWIGLSVHDIGWYQNGNESRELEPGMLMTVEPGIYISKNISGISSKWQNIGVRIEDTVLVTDSGCEVLTGTAPKTIDEIESIMSVNN